MGRYVKIDKGTAIVAVDGGYDLCNTVSVNAELETAFQQGCTKVVVDFTNTTFIDSSVIRDCTKLRRKVKPENFSAKGAKGKVLSALKSAKLDAWLRS
jgi:anti-anti-sigma regulatory factor